MTETAVTQTSIDAFHKNGKFDASNDAILKVLRNLGKAHTPQIVQWFDTNVPLQEKAGRLRERRIIGGLSDMKKKGIIACVGIEINPETKQEIEVYEVCTTPGPVRKTKLEEAREEIERLTKENVELKEQVETLILMKDKLQEELEALKTVKAA